MGIALKVSMVVLGLCAALALWVRIAPSAVHKFHIDPREDRFQSHRNASKQVLELEATIDEVLAAWPLPKRQGEGVKTLAGAPEKGHVTYITRTPILRFPDYTSFVIAPLADGPTQDQTSPEQTPSEQTKTPNRVRITVYGRSRFGLRDFGVNKERITQWEQQLRDALAV